MNTRILTVIPGDKWHIERATQQSNHRFGQARRGAGRQPICVVEIVDASQIGEKQRD
jgi:hypothetical protein